MAVPRYRVREMGGSVQDGATAARRTWPNFTPTQLRHRNGHTGRYPLYAKKIRPALPRNGQLGMDKSPTGAVGSLGRVGFFGGSSKSVRCIGKRARRYLQPPVAFFRRVGASRQTNGDWLGVGNFRSTSITNQIAANLGGRNRHPGETRGGHLAYWRFKEALHRQTGLD